MTTRRAIEYQGTDAQATGDGVATSPLLTTPLFFGDGSDGAAAFDGTTVPPGSSRIDSTHYVLTRDVYYTSATISNGVSVGTAGWRLFVQGTLQPASGSCTVHNNGGNGGNGGASTGGTAGVEGGRQTVGGANAQTGATGGTTAGGGTGTNQTNSYGGAGGKGAGNVGSTKTGGAGATVTNTGAPSTPLRDTTSLIACTVPTLGGALARWISGGAPGGGGAGGNTSNNGGGGSGAGAGVLAVYAAQIKGAVNFQANGGNGGNGNDSTAGGGGGGGGGVIVLVSQDTSAWTGTTSVSGGSVGTGGDGTAVAGSAGTVVKVGG